MTLASTSAPTSPRSLPTRLPVAGELVKVRSRRWLVEEVVENAADPQASLVRLACADDDAQGQALDVYWKFEPDRLIVAEEDWQRLAAKGFDPPDHFGAYLNTLRWSGVTATDPELFQSPFRAGIKVDAYQMEPLRKALRLARVNLFIADDTGLGKTIEAGLIARELLLRKKAKSIVVAAPPSVLEQWQAELDDRFGLRFEILDRAYLTRVRRERGFGVNPWRTHSRFLVSHFLLADPTYADPLREWLGDFQAGSLLILDEAHHAAPSSGGRYGIETKFTRAVRDIAWRFEHRLFLSATPHNGHSNSFSTLLELLDPYRFTRGVKVRPEALGEVMVRRLKEDIRDVQGGFPRRIVQRVLIDDLPDDAPELVLSRLLDDYRTRREARLAGSSRRAQAAAGLLVVGLQQRLLSSTEAFARSLKVHRATVERQWARAEAMAERDEADRPPDSTPADEVSLLITPPDADDERGTLTDDELEAEEDAAIEAATRQAEAEAPADDTALALWQEEQALLDEMQRIADAHRYEPDAKTRHLIDWIRAEMCPGLPPYGQRPNRPPLAWNDRRVIVFTENRQGTKRYLRAVLEQAISATDRAAERIEVIDGLTSGPRRREIQRRFNTPPDEDPLRILLATDAAREGLNFQAHCSDLFHFDLPWNPGRIEQRNGRIDRKLQPAPEVRCHYFVLAQRAEDHVLEVLVKKTATIQAQLGSMAKVIDDDIERRLLRSGIRHRDAVTLAQAITASDIETAQQEAVAGELERARARQDDLKEQIERCQTLLQKSREWLGFDDSAFKATLSCALELQGAPPLAPVPGPSARPAYTFPPLDRHAAADPSWADTLDALRLPRPSGLALTEWRRQSPIRPVVFEDAGELTDDTVHLHLEHRVAQRLMARFRSQGFVYHDLARACLLRVPDAIPRVALLGRLSLYGKGAERLHEALVPLTARWIEPSRRQGPLSAFAADGESKTLDLLYRSLAAPLRGSVSAEVIDHLLAAAARDVSELLPQLTTRGEELSQKVAAQLEARGNDEALRLRQTLEAQQQRVEKELAKVDSPNQQMTFHFNEEEKRQHDADVSTWRQRRLQFARDLETEPDRVRSFYAVQAWRVEPVGLVYLWPETN